jgi:hypothetical protein
LAEDYQEIGTQWRIITKENKEWEGGEISAKEGARQFDIHHKIFLSLIRKN